MTRSRIRKTFDFGRVREGLRGPGVDTRCWIAMAIVDDDADAIRWEAPYGWVADVTFQGGPLDQDGPVPCRVASSFARDNYGAIEPITRGAEVIVSIPEGDTNSVPIIVGQLFNGGYADVPTTVNGQSIDEAFALGTHILKSPHNLECEAGSTARISTEQKITLISSLIELSQNNPTQAYVRGTAFASAFQSLLGTWSLETSAGSAVASGIAGEFAVSNPALAAAAAVWATSLGALSSAISTLSARLVPGDLLSTKVKGE